MSHHWDEFSKSLAEPLPRRESLRRLGLVFAGAVLSPFGLESAWAAGRDPCKAFCRCSNKTQQNACLAACRACHKDTSRLCGSCGTYVCCGNGQICCGDYCADLADDVNHCGACGFVCDSPGPYEYVACIDGECRYICGEGAVYCDGVCTFLGFDPINCGACGNVCPDWAPRCNQGTCNECYPGLTPCGDTCVSLLWDPSNCGACGNVCPSSTPYCNQGSCVDCERCGGDYCVNFLSDPSHCGACGVVCPEDAPCCNSGICLQCDFGGP
jgi:hypothetical protein